MDQHTFLNPTTYFTVACVAFSCLAISSVWRNQQPPQPSVIYERNREAPYKTSPPRPRPRRRIAVDSLYANDEQIAAVQDALNPSPGPSSVAETLSQLIATCTRLSNLLRGARQPGASRLMLTSLLGELSLLTTSICRLQQAASQNEACFTSSSTTGASLHTTVATLSFVLNTLEEELANGCATEGAIREMLQQLRDQRPALEFLIESVSGSALPPTPPGEHAVAASLEEESTVSTGLLPAFAPSTGMTPSVDPRAWIEPPPEYSPPTNSAMAAQAEKADVKSIETSPPEAQAELDEEVYDTDALYNAVTTDDVDLMMELLALGASPDETIGDLQRNALHQAAHLNHVKCLAVLLQHSATMSIEDAKGDTALHLAAWAGHCEALAAILAHGADVDWLSGRDGYSPLWCAISAYHIDAARLLLKHGARVSLRSASGSGLLPLHQAAVTGQSAMCELLLERGAQVDSLDDDQNTPLHYAAACGSSATVKILLRGGADVSAAQAQGLTAAHWAAHKGHSEVLSLLLAYVAPVNACSEDGATPLHLAANRGHTQAARLLLEKGARRDLDAAWDGVEGTPAQMAKAKGHGRLAKLLSS